MAPPQDNEPPPGGPPIDQAARVVNFDRGLISSMVAGVRNIFSSTRTRIPGPDQPEGWMSPGRPVPPSAPAEDAQGRRFDYPVGINTTGRPRSTERLSFDTLRGFADTYDLVRLALETRKDQLAKLEWSILPRKPGGAGHRPKADDRCRRVEMFLRKPDKIHYWPEWVRMVAEDDMVIGAPALYLRRDRAGRPYAIEPLDGAEIVPLLDTMGRRPMPPDPAYTHIIKGITAAHYTADELLYFPRNPRTHRIYAMGIVEQIIMTIQTGLLRAMKQMETHSDGNIPDALCAVPENWTPEQIDTFQRFWDNIMTTASARRKMKFVPGQLVYQPTYQGNGLLDQMDEWIARIIAYAFSLPPTPFVRMVNRATAQSAEEVAKEEGLGPQMLWLKNNVDHIIADFLGEPELELVWDEIRKLDPAERAGLNGQFLRVGVKSLDEVRGEMGLEPVGLGPVIFGVGPLGFMSPKDMQRAIDMGLTMPQPPMMAPEGIDPMTGEPMAGMEEAQPGGDLLAGVPPELLASVGLREDGTLAEDDEQLDDDIEMDAEPAPAMAPARMAPRVGADGAAHPQVSAALNEAERALGRRG